VTPPLHDPARARLTPFHPKMIPEMVTVWNAAMGDAFPLSEALFRQNTVNDPHFDPAGCAVGCDPETGRVLGFCLAKVAREPLGADGLLPDRGWISAVAVDPSAQRKGVGTALLRQAEEFLRACGRHRAVLGCDPAHFFQGAPAESPGVGFFSARGYRLQGDAYDLRRSVSGYQTPAGVDAALGAHPDLEIRPLGPGEEGALLEFLDSAFPGRWRYSAGRFLASGGKIKDIMGVVRRGAVLGFALLFHPRSRWIGPSIAWTRHLSRPAGGLGPMGVTLSLRGRGIGLALLDRAVMEVTRRGVADMVIDWTILLDFYAKLGFVPWKHYRHGERDL
jgi:GNAT superfamily N-acetyltransferase